MKKALPQEQRAFLYEKGGKIYPEETCVEEVVAAVNRGIQGEWADSMPESIIFKLLHNWICRYLSEGASERFLNDLNTELRQIQYSNYVVPSDFYSAGGKEPESIFVVNMNVDYSYEAFAAKEFSRFITYGMLKKIQRCQYPGCQNIFLGPPQAKWCSKSCGSRYRVEKKRKIDSEYK